MQSVLLDTSFLITLTDSSRDHHEDAKKYYRMFIDRRVTMYLSAIVASEFQVRQEITDLPLENFLVLPFNINHATPCAALCANGLANRPEEYPRVSAKDDFKLLGQCQIEGITHFITDDKKCAALVSSLRSAGSWATLPMPIYVGNPFDSTFFNPSNQTAFIEEAVGVPVKRQRRMRLGPRL